MRLFEFNFEAIKVSPQVRKSFTEIIGLGSEVELQPDSTGGEPGQGFKTGKLKSGVIILRHAFTPEFKSYYAAFQKSWNKPETSSASVVIYEQDGTTIFGSFKYQGAKVIGVGVPVLSKDQQTVGEIRIAYKSCTYSSGGFGAPSL
jgi:hypothetical protein